jgi:hypothetical protein
MIEAFIKPGAISTRWWGKRRPNVLAIFAFRYDAHLVPDLIANIEPMVDGWIAYDDRAGGAAFSGEPARRKALVEKAMALGARWILAADPDERFEHRLAGRMADLTAPSEPRAYVFNLREMFSPTEYRVDGVWGTKRQARLLSLHPGMNFDLPPLHSVWTDLHRRYRILPTGLNLYHLKMIAPARREARRDLYNRLDPGRSYQRIGYDYLADDSGAVLKAIGRGRDYQPPHIDDGGMWMPEGG